MSHLSVEMITCSIYMQQVGLIMVGRGRGGRGGRGHKVVARGPLNEDPPQLSIQSHNEETQALPATPTSRCPTSSAGII